MSSFIFDFFLFNSSTLSWLRIGLHNFFNLLSNKSSWSYDLDPELDRLTWVFFPLFSWLFFQFYSSILSWLRIRLKICFSLCSMRLSWSHNSDHRFGWLIQMICFLSFLIEFHHSTLGWLKIELHSLFQFIFYGFILVLWPKFDRLTWVDLTYFFSWVLFSISSFNIGLIENQVY